MTVPTPEAAATLQYKVRLEVQVDEMSHASPHLTCTLLSQVGLFHISTSLPFLVSYSFVAAAPSEGSRDSSRPIAIEISLNSNPRPPRAINLAGGPALRPPLVMKCIDHCGHGLRSSLAARSQHTLPGCGRRGCCGAINFIGGGGTTTHKYHDRSLSHSLAG